MRLLKIILVAVLLVTVSAALSQAATNEVATLQAAAEGAATPGGAHGNQASAHHGLPAAAPVHHIGPYQFTSSSVITVCVAVLLILVAQLATRKVQIVPSGLQNFVEWLVEGMYNFFEEILGKDLVKKTFWFFCTIFLFILVTNWLGLIPGVGSVGLGYTDASGHFHLTKPWLRGGNADLNMTLAMALTFFVLWTVWSLQCIGPIGMVKHLFSSGAKGKDFMTLFIGAIFVVVGLIEIVSIVFRPVSLSFRLYGNIFAGENILEAMMVLVPWLGWILPLPFYFLELLVGLVQALVFALLTAVFTALMCAHHDDGHGHGDEEHKEGAHAH
jgi:F-type H+-transporting ATPase subunit a